MRNNRACMLAYSFYESDNRVRRYAETLARQGYRVDAVALRKDGQPYYESLNGVRICRIQERVRDEKNKFSYLYKLLRFFVNSALFISKQHMKQRYDLIHVHSIPDFEVFATIFAKMTGARIILDIHDIVPESMPVNLTLKRIACIQGFDTDRKSLNCIFWSCDHCQPYLGEDPYLPLCSGSEMHDHAEFPRPVNFLQKIEIEKGWQIYYYLPGTINWHQGIDIAVKAFAIIKNDVLMSSSTSMEMVLQNVTCRGLLISMDFKAEFSWKGHCQLSR